MNCFVIRSPLRVKHTFEVRYLVYKKDSISQFCVRWTEVSASFMKARLVIKQYWYFSSDFRYSKTTQNTKRGIDSGLQRLTSPFLNIFLGTQRMPSQLLKTAGSTCTEIKIRWQPISRCRSCTLMPHGVYAFGEYFSHRLQETLLCILG